MKFGPLRKAQGFRQIFIGAHPCSLAFTRVSLDYYGCSNFTKLKGVFNVLLSM